MRISAKILLTLLFVAIAPVAVSGVTSVVLARGAITSSVNDKLAAEARHLAELSETTILEATSDLAQAASLDLSRLTPEELVAALGIVYQGDARRNAIALIDGRTGEPVVDLVFQEQVGDTPGLRDHEPFSPGAMEAFAAHVPLKEALSAGRAVSPPYADKQRGLPLIGIAVRVDGPPTKEGPAPWVVAAELSLKELNRRFEEAADEGMRAFLVDLEGRAVCHTQLDVALARTPLGDHPAAARLGDPLAASSGVVPPSEAAGTEELSAWARANRLAAPTGKSWGVVVAVKTEAALAQVSDMSTRVGFWVGTALVLALLAGFILARGIAQPLESLARVVARFGGGDVGARAKLEGKDEIASLGGAFNRMADDIAERDRELHAFNEELQTRVDDRTRELKEAQDQLIQSQKQAAVGELGAGVAHEINNPLAGVLGSAQLALLRLDSEHPVHGQLKDIETEALRIREIVESLQQMSTDRGMESATALDLNDIIDSALALCARPIIAQRIQVKREPGAEVPKVRGVAADLQNVVMQLLQNARDAMPDGGTLTVRTENVDGKLAKLSVIDTGVGISEGNVKKVFEPFFTTRTQEGHKGMGLAIVQRVVEEHGGRITLDTKLGRGTEVRITFPATREQLHIA